MKLYNKTKYPNDLLENLLVEAGKSVGARTSNVIVKATSAKQGYHHSYGTAHRADYVYEWFLSSRAYKKNSTELKKRMISTDGGYYTITIPNPFIPQWVKDSDIYPHWLEAHCYDGISLVESIFRVACHEWRHIKQYQDRLFNFRDKQEQAKHHDNRSWEKDAIKASSKTLSKPRDKTQEAILNLALWIEANR